MPADNRSPPSRVTPDGSRRSTGLPMRSRTPASSSQAAMRAPTSSPSRRAWGAGSSLTSVTSRPERASEAAASQPMKPEPTTTVASVGASRSASESSRVRTDADPVGSRRAGAGGQHAALEPDLTPGLGHGRAGAGVEGGDAHAELEPNASFRVPILVLERQLLGTRLAAEIVLGERGPPVGPVPFGAHEHHLALASRLAKPARGRVAGGASADHEQRHGAQAGLSQRSSRYRSPVWDTAWSRWPRRRSRRSCTSSPSSG